MPDVRRFGELELTRSKKGDIVRIELDFKGRRIWSVCKAGEEVKTLRELLLELFEDELEAISGVCKEFNINIAELIGESQREPM